MKTKKEYVDMFQTAVNSNYEEHIKLGGNEEDFNEDDNLLQPCEVVGYYLYHYPVDYLNVWKENLTFALKYWKNNKPTEIDLEVTKILENI